MRIDNQRFSYAMIILILVTLFEGCVRKPLAVIYIDPGARSIEQLAAQEIRKYVYQRTGELLPVKEWEENGPIEGDAIIVGNHSSALIQSMGYELPVMGGDDFILKTLDAPGGKRLLVCGGSKTGTLYAAYHLAEQIGIGFYLEGDVVPDQQVSFVFPELDILQSPLFSRRGIQPFHDFPEGPDWWDKEDYKAVFAQLPKLKMNFFGLHTYPEGSVGPEPLTWIGLSGDINPDGTVKTAYHSRHFTTQSGTWGYRPLKTSDYTHGAGKLYDRDDFGVEYMRNRTPWPDPEDEAQLFNDVGAFLNDIFTFASKIGIQTCIGTEIPLVLPEQFIVQLQEKGLDPESPEVRQKIYEGIFTRIAKSHPLDFYWFWTPEDWTWSGNKKEDLDLTIRDFNAAIEAMKVVNPGFRLATCGWVLGPMNDRALFDNYLPKDIAFSCINRQLGWEPVDPAFLRISEREKWAIPWMEDDPALIIPQFWVGRMRRDAADAYAYGCNGYFGIHWRTRVLSMNVSSLAKAAWNQPWNPEFKNRISQAGLESYLIKQEGEDRKKRDMECFDFYQDWCKIQFGEEVSNEMANIFSSLDGVAEKAKGPVVNFTKLPRPSEWAGGPGGVYIDSDPWDSVRVRYEFIAQLEDLRPSVSGKGNLERFDYWLNQFKYLEATGKFSCKLGEYRDVVSRMDSLAFEDKESFATDILLPLLKEEIAESGNVYQHLIASVTTWGGIGNVTNWQQHIIPRYIEPQIKEIIDITHDSSWVSTLFPTDLPGLAKIVVPSPQTIVEAGEDYRVKVICFNVNPENAKIHWSPLGQNKYHESDLVKTSDTYWEATIPSGSIGEDFEYYILINDKNENSYHFPASAPEINHAVTLLKAEH